MNKIQRLLQEHCPNGVEWTYIGDSRFIEIADNNRKPVKSSNRTMGNNPYYGANNIQDYVDGYTHDGTYILVAEDGSASIKNYSIQWATGKFWANNHVHILRGIDGIDSRFMFHYLHTVNFTPFLTGGERAKLTKGKLLEIPIPLPPLPIQEEIVRILDKFTTLEAELEARKKQYEYYKDNLLTFGDEVEWKALGEVLEQTQNMKWQNNANVYKYIDLASVTRKTGAILETIEITASNAPSRAQKIVQTDDIIFATTRPTQMRITIIPKEFNEQVASTGYCVLRADKKQVLPKWIYFILSTAEFKSFLEENQSGSAYPAISDNKLKDFQIPLPLRQEQARIVAILDRFDTLVNSISEGLPKEIALRRKQYEYYREQLLSFPKR
jgi:restriction modification system DNA specificity domain protein